MGRLEQLILHAKTPRESLRSSRGLSRYVKLRLSRQPLPPATGMRVSHVKRSRQQGLLTIKRLVPCHFSCPVYALMRPHDRGQRALRNLTQIVEACSTPAADAFEERHMFCLIRPHCHSRAGKLQGTFAADAILVRTGSGVAGAARAP